MRSCHNQSTTLQQVQVQIQPHVVIALQVHLPEVGIGLLGETTVQIRPVFYSLFLEVSSAMDETTGPRQGIPARLQIRSFMAEGTDIFLVAGVKISIDYNGTSEL